MTTPGRPWGAFRVVKMGDHLVNARHARCVRCGAHEALISWQDPGCISDEEYREVLRRRMVERTNKEWLRAMEEIS